MKHKLFIDNKKVINTRYVFSCKVIYNIFNKLLEDQRDLPQEVNEIISKHFWEYF